MINYRTRMLQARDPRFAKIADRLYGTRVVVAEKPKAEDISGLRATYAEVVGKRPYHGWDEATLKAKIAEAKKG